MSEPGWGKRRGGAERTNWSREAMLGKRERSWRAFVDGDPLARWTRAGAIQALLAWAGAPMAHTYRNVGARAVLCGGGGDPANLADEAPSGLVPWAEASARLVTGTARPELVAAYAASRAGVSPEEALAYADALWRGVLNGGDASPGNAPETRREARGEPLDPGAGDATPQAHTRALSARETQPAER